MNRKTLRALVAPAAMAAALTAGIPIVIPAAQAAPPPARTPGLAPPPAGWAYLPELAPYGPADIFHIVRAHAGDQGPAIQMRVHTAKNVGILTRDVDVPLGATTQLGWRWKVDQIPSKLIETDPAHHDYFSIAVKFDNGRDLTYMWSAGLTQDFGFDCPLPGWTGREYHVVVRSGAGDLGTWLAEKRDVSADYAKYVGGKAPARIVQVWFIANTILQQGKANARFGDITLGQGGESAPVKVF
ncbi:MAG: DUF3047 domain-containing protein [Novosphingobium sp.]